MLNTRKYKIRLWKNKVMFCILAILMPVALIILFPITYVLSIAKGIKVLRMKIIESENQEVDLCNSITLPESFPVQCEECEINGKVVH